MPEPLSGGDLSKLWSHINIAEEDRPLLLAIMVDAFIQPRTPKPVTEFQAEHGTAKSTTAKRLVALIDPTVAELRSPPRDLETWTVTTAGSWVVALDNLSTIPDWLSDAICRASTGEAGMKRQLYTDEDISVIQFRRCVVITGIDVGGLNADLTDRLVSIKLKPIEEDDRKPETELEAAWATDYAAVLGGLLDLAAKVHAMLPTLESGPLPRMADFGRVLAGVDRITDSNGMERYRSQRGHLLGPGGLCQVTLSSRGWSTCATTPATTGTPRPRFCPTSYLEATAGGRSLLTGRRKPGPSPPG